MSSAATTTQRMGGCGRGDQVADAAPEVVGVAEEQRGVEPIQQQPGDLAGVRMTFEIVVALQLVLTAEHRVVGSPGPAYEVAQRQHNRHEDPDQHP